MTTGIDSPTVFFVSVLKSPSGERKTSGEIEAISSLSVGLWRNTNVSPALAVFAGTQLSMPPKRSLRIHCRWLAIFCPSTSAPSFSVILTSMGWPGEAASGVSMTHQSVSLTAAVAQEARRSKARGMAGRFRFFIFWILDL